MLATLLLIPALFISPTISAHWHQDAHAIRQYLAAIDGYIHTRHEAVAQVQSGLPCGGPEALEQRREETAQQIRLARRDAREGDIFAPAVADVLRKRLRAAFVETIVAPYDEGWEGARRSDEVPPADVNHFLAWEHDQPVRHRLLSVLPPLPEELEYRLAGNDLVLLDVNARIVVDVVREAVP